METTNPVTADGQLEVSSSKTNDTMLKPRKRGVLSSGILSDRFPVGETRETVLGQYPENAKELFPFYFMLPIGDPIAMLRWRVYCRKRCLKDERFRVAVWGACRKDVCFFAATFGVVFEPRPLPRWLPFTPYADQVTLLAWFEEIFGVRDGAVNKTRGIGLSWLTALFIFHKWLFVPEVKIAVLTKDKDLLDSPDANSLIGKFQYLFDNLPAWAKRTQSGRPLMSRLIEKSSLVNMGNKAVIQGFVSTATKLRQLRFTMIFADEFAFYDRTDQKEWLVSAGGCTNNLLAVSTWNDFSDTFHQLIHEHESALLRMHAFWQNNTERWQGAYLMDAGRPVLVDKNYKHKPGYQFGEPDLIDEGMLRSPWVDAELSRPSNEDKLKALRDIYGMSVCERTNSFFEREIQLAAKESVLAPAVQGLLDTTGPNLVIRPTLKSEIRTWRGVPEQDRGPYVMGCDLSQGVGAAYSVCVVLDKGGEQILEYGTNTANITTFSHNCVKIARWLAGNHGDGWVTIDFEGGGGQQAKPFAAELLRLNYGNIHMSESRSNTAYRGEVPKYAGTVNRDSGFNNFREMGRAILAMDTIPHSDRIPADMRLTGKDKDGKPIIPKGRKDGHGDFLHAYGVAWWRAKDRVSSENRALLESNGKSSYNESIDLLYQTSGLWSSHWE